MATYNDENFNVEIETNLNTYADAVATCKTWEKSWICLAQCQYKIFTSYNESQMVSEAGLESQEKLIQYFGESLKYGCKYIYQSMPRMLGIWLDYGTRLATNVRSPSSSVLAKNLNEQKKTMAKMNNYIESYTDSLPLFMFMTSFSQLLSRICHQHIDCYRLLKHIFVRIVKVYPEQSLWLLIAVSKSKQSLRIKRCQEILGDQLIQSDKKLVHYISCLKQLHDCLVDFGDKKHKESHVSFSVLNKTLPHLLSQSTFANILLPIQKCMTISLPRSNDYTSYNPYPQNMVYIANVKDEVAIYQSLQKPKKFTVIGSDGIEYPMLVKSNDDLRLDARLMDFFSIINMYLQRDAESRDRRLHIKTYSVLPLNENSGLIEWVSNLTTYRLIVVNLYKQINISVPWRDIRNNYVSLNDSLEQKRNHFLSLRNKFPPVLKNWYLQEFPHPTSWYQARTAFIRSTAVLSMVGYVVGLGDRHNENILFNNITGEIVHVDFSYCCNIGETFNWPERVPFRLTHNMIDAMGPTKYEGSFIQSCNIAMRVMRRQLEQLIAVLKPLIYDSVLKKDDKLRKDNRIERDNSETTNIDNIRRLNDIQLRLKGSLRIVPIHEYPVSAKQTQSLSVEGLTRSLIQQATDVDNLCQMFVGWAPFM